MALQRRASRTPARGSLPLSGKVVIAALAILGAITLVQWALAAFLGLVRLVLLVVVVLGVAAWVVSAKGAR